MFLISEYNFAEFSKLLPSDTRKIIREIENIRHGFRHRKIRRRIINRLHIIPYIDHTKNLLISRGR